MVEHDDFKAWKERNRERLALKFSRIYGLQVQEWGDFTEEEFRKSFRSGQSRQRK